MSQYHSAITDSGMLVIHSSPVTLSWIPRDVVNDAYNVGGIVTAGTFDSLDEAKKAASEQYQVGPADWKVSDDPPFQSSGVLPTEVHTPEIDGHHFVRHGIRWK